MKEAILEFKEHTNTLLEADKKDLAEDNSRHNQELFMDCILANKTYIVEDPEAVVKGEWIPLKGKQPVADDVMVEGEGLDNETS